MKEQAPAVVQVQPADELPSVSDAAVFYLADSRFYAWSEKESILLSSDVQEAAQIDEQKFVIAKTGEDQTHFWLVDLKKNQQEPLFSIAQGQPQMIPSPDGQRFFLQDRETGELFVYTIPAVKLQRITQKASSAHWSPDGRMILLFDQGTLFLSRLTKEGSFDTPTAIAQGVQEPVAFVTDSTILFQKTLAEVPINTNTIQPMLDVSQQPATPETGRQVFTIAKLTGETVDEYQSLVPNTATVVDQTENMLLFFDPATFTATVLSILEKKSILTISGVTQAQFSTDENGIFSIKNNQLLLTSLQTKKEELLTEGVNRLLRNP